MTESERNERRARLEQALWRVHDWLEGDRDRRSLVVEASHINLFWVALKIDHHVVSAADGYDLDELIAEALEGMVMPQPESPGTPVPEPEGAP